MTPWGAHMTCLWCGSALTHLRACVEHDARRIDQLACVDCGAEFAHVRELVSITPRPPSTEIDERARAYRARKKQVA